MKAYDPKQIESKWQKIWEETGIYRTTEVPGQSNFYCLVMFPYPSGDAHVGHWYNFAPSDAVARYHKMLGQNVLHPIGFDSFGLPAENAAIKRNIAPSDWTNQNIASMTKQLKMIGTMYDWQRLVVTSSPEYYRWTQWLFLKLYEAGLAYRAKGLQNWCPKDQTVLANEQVVGENNVCERCGTPVIKKELEQWCFKITDYADRLLDDLDKVTWPERVSLMQKNWIGRSNGASISFKVDGSDETIEIFTTRPDTLFGATYMVLAPEHPLVAKLTAKAQQEAVTKYVKQTDRATELERLEDAKAKTGVFTGAYAINPATNEKIPIWIADYVLMSYGTGAIMAVPAHDERDYAFAEKFKLPISAVVEGDNLPFVATGKLINSGKFNGLSGNQANQAVIEWLEEKELGHGTKNYKLRDWLISRQRYWGAPIPVVYCDKDGVVPLSMDQLPVVLPLDVEFEPTGQSPLSQRPDFYETTCPKCGGPARRETDTMDTFVDSSWYFLRYPNPNYSEGPFDPEAVAQWLPVDLYIGGIEHAILHLLYSRFITKVLFDQKLVSFDEPFKRLFNQGIILGPDGQKMSKSRGNVVNPDDWVRKVGADTFRMYLMFMGPYDQGGPFNTQGVGGVHRFLVRMHRFVEEFIDQAGNPEAAFDGMVDTELTRAVHKTIKAVDHGLQEFKFNTMVAALMETLNQFSEIRSKHDFRHRAEWGKALATFVQLLAPSAPHLAEELWHDLGNSGSVFESGWPKYDPELVKDELVEIAIQVDGKLRGTMVAAIDSSDDELKAAAAGVETVKKYLTGGVIKTIVVPRKLVNFVVK